MLVSLSPSWRERFWFSWPASQSHAPVSGPRNCKNQIRMNSPPRRLQEDQQARERQGHADRSSPDVRVLSSPLRRRRRHTRRCRVPRQQPRPPQASQFRHERAHRRRRRLRLDLKTMRSCTVPPRADSQIGHFVEGQIERDQRILALKAMPGGRVIVVVRVFGCQQDAGVEEPEAHGSGRVLFTSSAAEPPWP